MESTGSNKKIENLSVDAARELVAGNKELEIIILDVRQPEEYRSGHIPGAVFIPLPDLIDKVGELDPKKPVIAYCRSGSRSRAAAAFLLSEGFSKVYNIDGGITAWKGLAATGSYGEGLVLLKGRETTEEMISLALVLEEGSRIFYESVAELTPDEDAKKIFTTIAEAEERHKANIRGAYKLATGKNLAQNILQREPLKGIMEGGGKIEDAISSLKEQDKTLIDILEVAMQMETNALDLYIKISREIEDASAKKVFEVLIEEEKQHLFRLGRLIGERVS